MNAFLLLLIIPLYPSLIYAQGKEDQQLPSQVDKGQLPTPNEAQQLFYLQRDPNRNTVVYTLNIKDDGKIDESHPVNAYWILYEKGGEREDLSFIQRKLAYGIHHKKLKDQEYEIYLTSCKNIPLRLAYCPESKAYEAFTSIHNKPVIVERIFVRIDGGSMFKPHIDYIELTCRDSHTGQVLQQTFSMN